MGIPRLWEPRWGRETRRPGRSTSPGDEEDDSQRVGGDGEEVESERGPEGDEGATKEHRSRHDARGSQSPRALQCPVGSGCPGTGRGWVAKLRCGQS